jgi:hypothetical protein
MTCLILLRTAILPRPLALLAVVLGVTVPILGLAGLFTVTADNNGPVGAAIDALIAAQGLWIMAAAVTLPLRRPKCRRGAVRGPLSALLRPRPRRHHRRTGRAAQPEAAGGT